MRRGWKLVTVVGVTLGVSHGLWAVQKEQPEVGAKDVAALRQARVDVARDALALFERRRIGGIEDGASHSLAVRSDWLGRLAHAEIAAAGDDAAARTAAAERHLAALRELLPDAERMWETGLINASDHLRMKYELADAECRLAELRSGK